MQYSYGKTKLRIHVHIVIFNTYFFSIAQMVMRMRLSITLYYIGLPLAALPLLWKVNIYIGATNSLHGLSHIPLSSVRYSAVLFCNFILVRLLLLGTALSITEEFYFVVLLV